MSSASDLADFLEARMSAPHPAWRFRPGGGRAGATEGGGGATDGPGESAGESGATAEGTDSNEAGEPVCLGWIEGTIGEETLIWHNGGTGGFRSFVGFLPEQGRGAAFTVGSAVTYTLLAVLFFT